MGQWIKETSLRQLYEAKGAPVFTAEMRELIRRKELKLDNYSIRELAEATRFPTGPDALRRVKAGLFEDVDMSTFPTLNGEIIQSWMIPEFERADDITGRLCTEEETHDDPVRVGGSTALDMPTKHPPGAEKAETTTAEKYVSVPAYDDAQNSAPFSRIISLDVYDIWFDRTGAIKRRAMTLGEKFGELQMKEFFNRIQDVSAYYVYYPLGTRTAIYTTATAADTTGMTPRYTQQVNALADYTDINNAEAYLQSHTDEKGDPITVGGTRTLIAPAELEATALAIRVAVGGTPSKMEKLAYSTIAVLLTTAEPNFEIVTSRYLSAQATTTWYWGNPRKQFVRLVFRPLTVQTITLPPTAYLFVMRDIVLQVYGDWWKRTIAVDYRYMCKNTAS